MSVTDGPSSNGPAKPFSLSFGSKPKASAPSKVNPKKRPYSSLAADGSDHDDDRESKSVLVHSFDRSAGGAISTGSAKQPKVPLVIAGLKNKDWREQARKNRGKNLLPEEEQARRAADRSADAGGEESRPSFGLVIPQRFGEENEGGSPLDKIPNAIEQPRTDEEEAIDALMGKPKKSSLVIERSHAEPNVPVTHLTEGDAFKRDFATLPDAPSLADYDAIPATEDYGVAILRGLGWREGEAIGRKKGVKPVQLRQLERRGPLLGLGAKEVPEGLEELGAWGKGAKKNRIDRSYNPIVLRNARTGEMLTEEELKARKDENKSVAEDQQARSDKDVAADERKKSHRHRHDKERSSDLIGGRYSSSRRNRSRSRSKDNSRERTGERHRLRDRERYHDEDLDRHKEKQYRDRHNDYEDRRYGRSRYSDDVRDNHRSRNKNGSRR